MENCIEVKNITRTYPQFSLKNVTFSVPCGSVVGFIGENADELSPATKEKIGVVFDGLSFPENLTVKQLDKVMSGIYKTWNSERFFGYMAKFELPLGKTFKSFSRGMVMRLSIAAALSHDTQLLILDEPTSGLDPVMRSEILDIFLEFMQDESHSILISTHITSDLEHIADYICFIHKGEIMFTEERNEMMERHRILKCTDEQLNSIDKADIIGVRRGRFQNEVLTTNAHKYPDIPADAPSIEEIMVFYVKD